MSAVTLPQKAGYVATTKEWDDLVRIAENLASQVVQRDAALRQMQAELDAAREHAERQQLSKDGLYRELREVSSQRDAARAEVARLTAAIDKLIQAPKNGSGYEGFEKAYDELKALRQPAPAQTCRECRHHESEHMKVSSKFAIVACSRMGCDCVKPAPAPAQE